MISFVPNKKNNIWRVVVLSIMFAGLLPFAQAKTLYVATTGLAENDGLSAGKPLPTISAAVESAASGDVILVDEGTYQTSATLIVPAGIAVRALKGPGKTEIAAAGSPDDLVKVDGSGAVFCGFAVSGANGMRAVHVVNDGIVSNCVIRNSSVIPRNDHVAVWVENGTLTHSTVTNNAVCGSYFEYTKGSAVRLSAGLVDSCIIMRNSGSNSRPSIKPYSFCGAVYIENGIMRNSLVAQNSAQYNASGVYLIKGKIDGCTIADNCNRDSNDVKSAGLYIVGSRPDECTVFNSIIWGNENKDGIANIAQGKFASMSYLCTNPAVPGEGNVSDDPNFGGNYRIGLGASAATMPKTTVARDQNLEFKAAESGRARVPSRAAALNQESQPKSPESRVQSSVKPAAPVPQAQPATQKEVENWLMQTNEVAKLSQKTDASLPDVLILGDSISLGYTPIVQQMMAGKANISRPPTNCGSSYHYIVPGKDGVVPMKKWVGEKHYKVITVNFGIWDNHYNLKAKDKAGKVVVNLWSAKASADKLANEGKAVDPMSVSLGARKNCEIRTPIYEYKANLREILGYLKGHADKVVFCLTTPVPEWLATDAFGRIRVYNEMAVAVCAEMGVDTIDLYSVAEQNIDKYRADKVHFTPEGYKILAAEVVKGIEKNLQ